MKKYNALLLALFLLIASYSLISYVNADSINKSEESFVGLKLIPEEQTIDLSEGSPLNVEFEQGISEGQFFNLINLVDINSNKSIDITKSIEGHQLIITPQIALENDKEYILYIPPYSLANTNGEKLKDNYILKFIVVSEESYQQDSVINSTYQNLTVVESTYDDFNVINSTYGKHFMKTVSLSETTNESVPFLTQTTLVGGEIYAGIDKSGFIDKNGGLWLWGDNGYIQLGDATTPSSQTNTPVQLAGTNVVTMNKGFSGGTYSSYALKTDGTVTAFGFNYWGFLGLGPAGDQTDFTVFPTSIYGLSNVNNISSRFYHTLAVKSNGSLWGWGDNQYGQVGGDSSELITIPEQIKGVNGIPLTNIIASDVGETHSIALSSNGNVYVWGGNNHGQLGNGTLVGSNIPRLMLMRPNNAPLMTNIKAISSGDNFNLVLKDDGTVWSWGQNDNGQLGDGSTVERRFPVQVKGENGVGLLKDIIAISGGGNYSLALKSDGTVWSWGGNNKGQLGDGTTERKLAPTKVKASNVLKIDAGESHSIALTENAVITWGNNEVGQLGNGSMNSYSSLPVNVIKFDTSHNNEYIYDSDNRLSAIIIHKGNINYRRDYVYDGNGNLLSAITKVIQ